MAWSFVYDQPTNQLTKQYFLRYPGDKQTNKQSNKQTNKQTQVKTWRAHLYIPIAPQPPCSATLGVYSLGPIETVILFFTPSCINNLYTILHFSRNLCLKKWIMKKWKNSENVIQENKTHEIQRYVGRQFGRRLPNVLDTFNSKLRSRQLYLRQLNSFSVRNR